MHYLMHYTELVSESSCHSCCTLLSKTLMLTLGEIQMGSPMSLYLNFIRVIVGL